MAQLQTAQLASESNVIKLRGAQRTNRVRLYPAARIQARDGRGLPAWTHSGLSAGIGAVTLAFSLYYVYQAGIADGTPYG